MKRKKSGMINGNGVFLKENGWDGGRGSRVERLWGEEKWLILFCICWILSESKGFGGNVLEVVGNGWLEDLIYIFGS